MSIRKKIYTIIFETDTKAGKAFDVFLLWAILFSAITVMIESVPEIGTVYLKTFYAIEWILTIIFSLEFLVRILVSPKPIKYIFSFWGIVDLLSILPTYLSIFITGYHYFLIIRIFRLLRVFRILKLARFNAESQVLIEALKSSLYKISIFLFAVVAIVIFMGTIMYVIEGGKEGFTSIPQSIYWAVVTITTVGYGDMVPHTVLGKFISSIAMILGYSILAIPTGIVTVEMAKTSTRTKSCSTCNHKCDDNADFCSFCGNKLSQEE